jgi:REP element-mobilizing transposase RayT
MNEYPRRLHHKTPAWIKDGAVFHVRIRVDSRQVTALVAPSLAPDILKTAQRYHEPGKWWCDLMLLMPDHLHALLVFPREPGMPAGLRDWKRGTARFQGVKWQDNFFDHRIRNNKEGAETWRYIRRNPVAKGLCLNEGQWPWWWSGSLERGGMHP